MIELMSYEEFQGVFSPHRIYIHFDQFKAEAFRQQLYAQMLGWA